MKIIADVIRGNQEEDAEFGAFFEALHKFADRTIDRFFADTPDIPHPVIALEKVRASCRGVYHPKDGLMLAHRITIDPFQCKTGLDVAEVLAHELVHLWQDHVKKLPERNYHNSEFHARLGLLGIISEGKRGKHRGYYEGEDGSLVGVWHHWLQENADLHLDQFVLPGADGTRQLHKFQCPLCGFSFRTRREEVNVVCMMEECDVPMEPA